MLGEIVTLKADGRSCLVKRDGVRDDGVRILRLRPLDGGPLLFVEPSEVTLAQPIQDTGRAESEVTTDEAQLTEAGDD